MKELDTASDFINYLTRKEELFQNADIIAFGEEDMLARYLSTTDDKGIHNFNFIDKKNNDFFNKDDKKHNLIIFEKDAWENINNNPQYLNKKKADEISYAWDYLLEKSIKHYMSGTQLYRNESIEGKTDVELFTILSSFNRFERRIIGQNIIDVMEKTERNCRRTREILINDTVLIIFILPRMIDDDKKYRDTRKILLERYLYAAKVQNVDMNKFIGVALESKYDTSESEDFAYLNTSNWNNEDLIRAKKIEELLIKQGLLSKRTKKVYQVEEYPTINFDIKMNGNNRNKPCPCGSGKKFKKCCGKS